MPITAKLDELGKPAWIALIVLGFWVFWPLGLAILVYTIWSGRMGCGYHGGSDRWQHKMERMQSKMDWMRAKMSGGARRLAARAFERQSRLRRIPHRDAQRLEEEQREFREFLDRLRIAKDKAEFDQFMAERRNRPAPDAPQPGAAAALIRRGGTISASCSAVRFPRSGRLLL